MTFQFTCGILLLAYSAAVTLPQEGKALKRRRVNGDEINFGFPSNAPGNSGENVPVKFGRTIYQSAWSSEEPETSEENNGEQIRTRDGRKKNWSLSNVLKLALDLVNKLRGRVYPAVYENQNANASKPKIKSEGAYWQLFKKWLRQNKILKEDDSLSSYIFEHNSRSDEDDHKSHRKKPRRKPYNDFETSKGEGLSEENNGIKNSKPGVNNKNGLSQSSEIKDRGNSDDEDEGSEELYKTKRYDTLNDEDCDYSKSVDKNGDSRSDNSCAHVSSEIAASLVSNSESSGSHEKTNNNKNQKKSKTADDSQFSNPSSTSFQSQNKSIPKQKLNNSRDIENITFTTTSEYVSPADSPRKKFLKKNSKSNHKAEKLASIDNVATRTTDSSTTINTTDKTVGSKAADERTVSKTADESISSKTSEESVASKVKKEKIATETADESNISKTTEESISSKITEESPTSNNTNKSIASETTNENNVSKIAGESIASKATDKSTTSKTTDESNILTTTAESIDPKAVDESISSKTTDENIASKTTDESSTSTTTDENIASNTTEESITLKTTEENAASKTTDGSIASKTTGENVASKITNKNLASKTTDNSISSKVTDETNISKTTEESIASRTGEESVASTAKNKRVATKTSDESLASKTRENSKASKIAEGSMASRTTDESIPPRAVDENIASKTTDENIATKTEDGTNTSKTTEESITSKNTEESNFSKTAAEIIASKDTEESIASKAIEKSVASKAKNDGIASRTTDESVASKTAEIGIFSRTTDGISTKENSNSFQMAKIASSGQEKNSVNEISNIRKETSKSSDVKNSHYKESEMDSYSFSDQSELQSNENINAVNNSKGENVDKSTVLNMKSLSKYPEEKSEKEKTQFTNKQSFASSSVEVENQASKIGEQEEKYDTFLEYLYKNSNSSYFQALRKNLRKT